MNNTFSNFGTQQPLKIQLDNKERGFYAGLHQQADPYDTNKIGGVQAVQFFKRSGVPVDILKRIWLLSSSNGETLSREEFYIALKLISYAQNNIEVSRESISRQVPSPLPKFQIKNSEEPQIDENIFKIHPQQEQNYNQYVKQLDPYESNTIQTTLAMQMFLKSQLTESQIQQIINLIDPSISSKIKMTIPQYKVIIHLISLHRQGIALPPTLPNCLQQVLKLQTEQDKIQQIPKISPKAQINVLSQIQPQVQKQTQSESAFSSFGSFGGFESNYHSQPKIQLEPQLQFNIEQQKSISQTSDNQKVYSQQNVQLSDTNKIKEDKYSAFDILNIETLSQPDVPVAKKTDLLSDTGEKKIFQEPSVKLEPQDNKLTAKLERNTSKNSDFSDFQQNDTQNSQQLISSQVQLVELNTASTVSIPIPQTVKLTQEVNDLKQNIETEYQQKLKPEMSKIQVQQTVNLQENVINLNGILDVLRICNTETLKQRETENEEINTILQGFQEIQKKINNEQELFQQEMKEIEEKRQEQIHGLNRAIIEINNSLGINVKTRVEARKKSAHVNDDISNYAQNLIQDINMNVSNAHQQRLKRDEQISKELQDQRQLILSLEKQVKQLAIKIEQISVRPLSIIDFPETYKEETISTQFQQIDFPQQGQLIREKLQPQNLIQTPNELPLKQDEVQNKYKTHDEIDDPFSIDLKQQVLDNEFQFNQKPSGFDDFEQQPKEQFGDLEFPKIEIVQQDETKEKKINQIEESEIWSKMTEQSQQFTNDKNFTDLEQPVNEIQSVPVIINDDQLDQQFQFENKHQSPKVQFNSEDYFISMTGKQVVNQENLQIHQDDKVLWRNPENQLVSPEQEVKSPKEAEVQIEFDFNAQFGQSEWNEFNSNFFGGFGNQQQPPTQEFGFDAPQNQNIPKVDDFSSFNW